MRAYPIPGDDLQHPIDHEFRRVRLLHDVIDRCGKPVPLLGAREMALPQDDEPGMQLDIQQIEKIPDIRCNDHEIVVERVPPDAQIGLPGKADMRGRDRVKPLPFGAPADELRGTAARR